MKKIIKMTALFLALVLAVSSLAACSVISPGKKLVGKWTDSNKLSGYEFHEDGTVDITYVNFTIPIINMPFNGTVKGAYTVGKTDNVNTVTLTYTVFSKSIEKTYQFKVEEAKLTLIDPEDGGSTVYIKESAEQ